MPDTASARPAQAVLLVIAERMGNEPDLGGWLPGPLPVDYVDSDGVETKSDGAWRRSKFDQKMTSVVQPDGRRWHRTDLPWPGASPFDVRLIGLELVAVPVFLSPARAYVVLLHVELPPGAETLDALRTLTPSHLLNARNPLVQAVRDLTGLDPDLKERVGTVAWSGYEALALPRADVPAMAVPPGLQQARALASLNPDNGIRYDADDDYWALGDRRVRGALSMSVLRDGIALVSERLAQDKYEAPRAIGATRSYYVDIMLLAVMQRLAIRDLEDALARLGDDPTTMRGGVAKLDLALMRFRNRLWMTEVSNARVANEVLETLQMNHRLPDRLTELRSGVNDSVRIVDTYELRTTNDLLKILTMASVIIGLPAAVALGGFALAKDPTAGLAAFAFAAFVVLAVASAGVLYVWQGRQERRAALTDLPPGGE